MKPIDEGENIKFIDNDENPDIKFVEEPTYDPMNIYTSTSIELTTKSKN